MRKTTYVCDHCHKEIGEKVHISMSFGRFSGIAIPPSVLEFGRWKIMHSVEDTFMHFCDEKHLAAWWKVAMDANSEKKKKKV